MVSVFVVAEIRLYRDGLELALSQRDDFRVLGAAWGDEALRQVAELGPDVALVDASSDEALAILRGIRRAAPRTKAVVMAVREVEEEIMRCAEIGIAGYVPRADGSLDQLVETIESVVRGETPCSPRIAATLFTRVAALTSEQRLEPALTRLTPRQLDVARLLGRGLSNKEIATSLQIELPTAKNHVHAVLEKLGVQRRGQAAAHLAVLDLDVLPGWQSVSRS